MDPKPYLPIHTFWGTIMKGVSSPRNSSPLVKIKRPDGVEGAPYLTQNGEQSPCIPRAPTMDHGGTRKEVVPASHVLEPCSTLVPTLHRSIRSEKRQRDAESTLNSSCWQYDLSNM